MKQLLILFVILLISSETKPQPLSVTADIGGNCGDSCRTLKAIPAGGMQPYTFSWSPNIGSGSGPHNICNTSYVQYKVIVTDINGTSVVDSAGWPLIISDTSRISTCGRIDGRLCAVAKGGSPPYTYLWKNPGNGIITANCLDSIRQQTYTVTVSDSKQCSVTQTLKQLGDEYPLPVIDAGFIACGKPAVACATAMGGLAPFTYSWSNGDSGNCMNNIKEPGIYTVTVTDITGCLHTSTALIIKSQGSEFYIPNPIIKAGDTIPFNNFSSSGNDTILGYKWIFGDGSVDSISKNPTHIFSDTGTFTACLVVYYSTGCNDTSCTQIISMGSTAGFIEIIPSIQKKIIFDYRGIIIPVYYTSLVEPRETVVDIFTTEGRLIFSLVSPGHINNALLLSSLSPGFYLIRIRNGEHLTLKKVIIQ